MSPKKDKPETPAKKTTVKAKTLTPEEEEKRKQRLENEKLFLGIKNPHIKKSYQRAGGERLAKSAYDPIRKEMDSQFTEIMVKSYAFKGEGRKLLLVRDIKEALKVLGILKFGIEPERICA